MLTLSGSGSRLVPLSLAFRTSGPVADLTRALWLSKGEIARQNFSQVLGLPPGDPAVERAARLCFRHFARYITEIMHVQGWGADDVLDRLTVEGESHLDEAAAAGKGIIFVSAHMGSPEVGAAMAVLKGHRVTSVVEGIKPDFLMDYFVRSRRRMGITLLPATGAGISLIRTLRRRGMVAFVVDAGIERNGAVPVTFFGRRTVFPEGPARLARLTGAPIVFAVTVRRPHGRYTAHIRPPLAAGRTLSADASVARLTQEVATVFEGFVRRYPEQWYAFRPMWPEG